MCVRHLSYKVTILSILLGTVSLPVLAQEMKDVTPPETLYSRATAVSADGSAVIGVAHVTTERDGNSVTSQQAYRWNADGWQILGTLTADGSGYSHAAGVSADGAVVVGTTDIEHMGRYDHQAYRWTSEGMVSLGTFRADGLGSSNATGVSADGTVVVGDAQNDQFQRQAFRWTSQGMENLGSLQSDQLGYSYAGAVSADGLVVVGNSRTDPINGGTYDQAFRWTSGVMAGLGTLRADQSGYSYAGGVSADGAVVIGYSETDAGNGQAFRWTEGGMEGLGTLRSDNSGYSNAQAVSADGSVIVGNADTEPRDDGQYNGQQAFRWTESDGMLGLGTLRSDNTGDSQANAVSANGSVIVGAASTDADQQAFLWTAGNMVGLGTLRTDGSGRSVATGVSADGAVIIGQSDADDNTYRAFIYRAHAVDPTPVDPTPVDPVPVDPTPVDPVPVDPTPVDPVPVDPTPVDPVPVDPTPVDPTPVDPTPVDPTPVDPVPVDPTPVDPVPVDPTPVDPVPVDPTPVDPVPVDPTPVDPVPVDPVPVDPTPVDPTPVDPVPVDPTPVPPGTMLDLENTQTAIVQAARRQERKVESRSTDLVSLLGRELDLSPLSRPGLNGRMSSKGNAAFSARRPFSIRLDSAYATGGDTDDMGIVGGTAATLVAPRLTLGGSVRQGVTSEGDALSFGTYIRSRQERGNGLTWRGAIGYSFGDTTFTRDNTLSNTERGEGEASIKTYAASAELGYGIATDHGLFTPFARLTHSETTRDGYSEAATADFPVTYEDYTLTTTVLTMGVNGQRDISMTSQVRFGAGIEFDISRSDDLFRGSSRVPGLEEITMEAPDVRNEARPYVSVGFSKMLTNGSMITLDVGAQTTPYSSQSSSYVAAGYQMNF